LLRALRHGDRFLGLPHRHQKFAVPVVDHRVRWIECDRALEILVEPFAVPVVQANVRERSVRFTQFVVEIQRLARGGYPRSHGAGWQNRKAQVPRASA
jgi:hypothetical protein